VDIGAAPNAPLLDSLAASVWRICQPRVDLLSPASTQAPTSATGPLKLEGGTRGNSVLILGAGLAGMCAAHELREAGYTVQILEYNDRPRQSHLVSIWRRHLYRTGRIHSEYQVR
jgi:NADPH-dependent 2,4-dienoyl-CoA reductase/sulfur reductase-like enzyme